MINTPEDIYIKNIDQLKASIKALLKSSLGDEEEEFYAVAMQIAAQESNLGDSKFAKELKNLIDQVKIKRSQKKVEESPLINASKSSLVETKNPDIRLCDLMLSEDLVNQLNQVVKEHRGESRLFSLGLFPCRKLLFRGSRGMGTDLAALALAKEMGLPFFEVKLDPFFLPLTEDFESKMRQVFTLMSSTRGLFFFDEFLDPSSSKESFKYFQYLLEKENSNSLIVVSTSHFPGIYPSQSPTLFDKVLSFGLLTKSQIEELLQFHLDNSESKIDWPELSHSILGLGDWAYKDVYYVIHKILKELPKHEYSVPKLREMFLRYLRDCKGLG
jgi:hypothetical protein